MQNIIVLGHKGKIGKEIYNYLRKNKNFKIFVANKNNFNQISKYLTQVDVVINCVGEHKNKRYFIDSNYIFIKKILKSIKLNNKCPILIHFSSCSIYQNTKNNLIYKNSKISSNLSLYPKSKMLAENYIISEHKKKYFNFLIIRIPQVLGNNFDNSSLNKIKKLFRLKTIFLIANLNYYYNYVLSDDINIFINNFLSQKFSKINKTILISENISYKNLITLLLYRYKTKLNNFEIFLSIICSKLLVNLAKFKIIKIPLLKTLLNTKQYISSDNIGTTKLNKKNIFNLL